MSKPSDSGIDIDVRYSTPDWAPYEQPKGPEWAPNSQKGGGGGIEP